MMCTKVLTTVV